MVIAVWAFLPYLYSGREWLTGIFLVQQKCLTFYQRSLLVTFNLIRWTIVTGRFKLKTDTWDRKIFSCPSGI